MARIEEVCCGDCNRCELLNSGRVDMIPCATDQINRRLIRVEQMLARVMARLENAEVNLASDKEQEEQENQQN